MRTELKFLIQRASFSNSALRITQFG